MDDVQIRAPQPQDAAALAALFETCGERGEIDGYHNRRDAGPISTWLVAEPTGARVAVDRRAEAGIVGVVAPDPKWLIVAPTHRRRGIGRALVAAALEIERGRGRADLFLGPVIGHEAAFAFLAAMGFHYHSSTYVFELDAGVVVPPQSLPDGFELRRPEPAADDATTLEAVNASFADHPTPLQMTQNHLELSRQDPAYDPQDLILLVQTDAPGTAIGFCEAELLRDEDGTLESGDVHLVGVVPAWQGRGLGRELLRWGIHRLREAGVPRLTLSVNATNAKALRLYEQTGFRRTAERPRWVLST